MMIWIAMAVLAAASLLPLLLPLARSRWDAPAATSPAVAIYRDQLSEIDRDLDRGTIAASEAEAARTEIARRLIKAGAETAPSPRESGRVERIAVIAIVAMPIAALGLYLFLGAPNIAGQPLTSRPELQQTQDIAVLVAAVEAHLATAPDDGEGWEVLAPIYVRLGRYDDAAAAYGSAIRLLGATAERELQMGDAMVRGAGGTVTPAARAAFERARDLAPDDPRPRFYLAIALGQAGDRDAAVAAWRKLIADAPADASWLPGAERELAKLEATPATLPGPTAADVEAAAELAPEDRDAMIEGMVASLAANLAENPDNAEGWARLVRSYMVLGRADDARATLTKARAAFFSEPDKRAVIDRAAREAGLGEGTE